MDHPWPAEYVPDPSILRHRSIPSLETSATGITLSLDDRDGFRGDRDRVPPLPSFNTPHHASSDSSSTVRTDRTVHLAEPIAAAASGVSHRHVPSLNTNASGLAESTISTWTTDSIGLPAFPAPPPDIPTPSPRHTEFDLPAFPLGGSPLTTPTRANFGNTTPPRKRFSGATSHSSHSSHGGGGVSRSGTPFRFGTPPPPSLYINKSNPGSPIPQSTGFDFNSSVGGGGSGRPPPLLLTSSTSSTTGPRPPPSPLRSVHSVPSLGEKLASRSAQADLPADGPLIPKYYDWHDSSSVISVDSTEERLLSTDFISSLLTATTRPAGPRMSHQGDGSTRARDSRDGLGVYTSVRPNSPGSGFPYRETHSPHGSLAPSQATGGLTQASNVSGASEMRDTLEHTIVRTASRVWGARRDNSLGQSVVGTAPATFRTVSAVSTHRTESTVPTDAASQVASLVTPSILPGNNVRRSTVSSPPPSHTFDAPDDINDDDERAREVPPRSPLGASPAYRSPDEYGVLPTPATPFSPALASAATAEGFLATSKEIDGSANGEGGWQPPSAWKERRLSAQTSRTSRTTKSHVSSLISRFTPSFINFATGSDRDAARSSSSLGRRESAGANKRSWFSKRSLPPVPRPPSMADVNAADARYHAKMEREGNMSKAAVAAAALAVDEDEKNGARGRSDTVLHIRQKRSTEDGLPAGSRASEVVWPSGEAGEHLRYQYIRGYGPDGDQYSTAAEVGTIMPGGRMGVVIGTDPTTASRVRYTMHDGAGGILPASEGGVAASGNGGWWPFRKNRGAHRLPSSVASSRPRSAASARYRSDDSLFGSRRVRLISIGSVVAIIVVVMIIVFAVIFGRRRHSSLPSCSGNSTGQSCDLDATCVCTTTTSGQCDQLAQALITLTPMVNELFNESFTPNQVSDAVWAVQGSPTGSNCAQQALLVDVGPTLQQSSSPNRTNWARAALLWNLVLSEDLSSTSSLQSFVTHAPWNSLSESDGKVSDSGGQFNTSVAGYAYDFAAQELSVPGVSFVDNGNPSGPEIAEVDGSAVSSLNRMYSFAVAASTQRSSALSNYWSSVLQQPISDLATFISSVQQAPILLPFDVTASPGGHAIADLMSNSTTNPFPPPLACYPGLSSSQLASVGSIETLVYGMSAAPSVSSWDTSCYADRPIYGVLDILRQRLPFADSRTGAAKQAVVLSKNAYSRAVVRAGEGLAALPGASDAPSITNSTLDPRQYGTMDHLEHVILNYLTSLEDTQTASNVVQYVLTFPSVPPPSTSAVYPALPSLPAIEVAVFGSVTPEDISAAVSSFATPSGALFFGDPASQVFRDWTLTGTQSYIQWTNSTTAPSIVHDSSFTNDDFNSVWNPAVEFFATNSKQKVGVSNVTQAFQNIAFYTDS